MKAGTTYHYVIVATNQSGTSESTEETFTTFPYTPVLEDKCANAHVRQQTGAALLADCRAYELVSAANAGGYDVESYLNCRTGTLRRLPDAPEPDPRPLRGPRRRDPRQWTPDQPRPRSLHRHPRADGWSTSYAASRPTCPTRPNRSPRRSPERTPRWTPSPSAAPGSARPASQTARPAFRWRCPTAPWFRAWLGSAEPGHQRDRRHARQEPALGRRQAPDLRLDLGIREPAQAARRSTTATSHASVDPRGLEAARAAAASPA